MIFKYVGLSSLVLIIGLSAFSQGFRGLSSAPKTSSPPPSPPVVRNQQGSWNPGPAVSQIPGLLNSTEREVEPSSGNNSDHLAPLIEMLKGKPAKKIDTPNLGLSFTRYMNWTDRSKDLEEYWQQHLIARYKAEQIQVSFRPMKVKPGRRIAYLKSVARTEHHYANLHLAFLNKIKILQSIYHIQAPINLVWQSKLGKEVILHHCFLHENTMTSSYQKVSPGNWKEVTKLADFIASINEPNVVNLSLVSDKKLSRLLGNKFDSQGKTFSLAGVGFKRNLWEKLNTISHATARTSDRDSFSYVDGLPQDLSSLISTGYSVTDIGQIEHVRYVADSLFNSSIKKINTKESLFKELREGESNIVFVLAHASKEAFFINGEKINLEELEKLAARESQRSTPRKIVLLSCGTGNMNATKGIIFKTKIKCLAQILIEKNYADLVIAPTEEIDHVEIVSVLKKIISGQSVDSIRTEISKKWIQIVSAFPKNLSPSKFLKLYEYYFSTNSINA